MSRRIERVGNLIRNTLGEILLSKMSDPRFDPALTSITHVTVSQDMLSARVCVSVNGDKTQQNRIIASLRGATGFLQERMMRRIQLRNTPRLEFVLDDKFRKTLDTLNLITEISEELRLKDLSDEAGSE